MNDNKKYNWGNLIVTVDYAEGFDWSSKNIVDKKNYVQTITANIPATIISKNKTEVYKREK